MEEATGRRLKNRKGLDLVEDEEMEGVDLSVNSGTVKVVGRRQEGDNKTRGFRFMGRDRGKSLVCTIQKLSLPACEGPF